MVDVMFIRTPIDSAFNVSVILQNLYRAGWRVVSHSYDGNEYSFVLEGDTRFATVTGYVVPAFNRPGETTSVTVGHNG